MVRSRERRFTRCYTPRRGIHKEIEIPSSGSVFGVLTGLCPDQGMDRNRDTASLTLNKAYSRCWRFSDFLTFISSYRLCSLLSLHVVHGKQNSFNGLLFCVFIVFLTNKYLQRETYGFYQLIISLNLVELSLK